MEERYDVYGFKNAALKEIVLRLENDLGIQLLERDSGYYSGIYYLFKLAYGQELRLFNNFDPMRSDWVRESFKKYDLILEVSALPNMNEIQKKLINGYQNVTLLSSRILK